MKSGTRLNPGDLVLVPFPFTDLSSRKARPALVLSRAEYNEASREVIVAGVTSNLTNASHGVLIRQAVLHDGRLLATSRVKVDKIATLEQGVVRKRLGRLKAAPFDRVVRELHTVLASPA